MTAAIAFVRGYQRSPADRMIAVSVRTCAKCDPLSEACSGIGEVRSLAIAEAGRSSPVLAVERLRLRFHTRLSRIQSRGAGYEYAFGSLRRSCSRRNCAALAELRPVPRRRPPPDIRQQGPVNRSSVRESHQTVS